MNSRLTRIVLAGIAAVEAIMLIITYFQNISARRENDSLRRENAWNHIDFETQVKELQRKLSCQQFVLMTRYRNEDLPIRCCPYCLGDVVPIIYGNFDAYQNDSINYDLSGRMRYIPGGRIVEEADWRCVSCERKFVVNDRTDRLVNIEKK